MPSKIIGVGHHKEVGKDTFIKYCIDHLRNHAKGQRLVRRGFADKMYTILHDLYGWSGFKNRQYYVNNPAAKNDIIWNGMTVREMLIEFGTNLCRKQWDDDIWINATLRDEDFDILFISDLRFPNEFMKVREMGGMTVRVTNDRKPKPTDIADCALDGWEDKWDLTIKNDTDLGTLYHAAVDFTNTHLLGKK